MDGQQTRSDRRQVKKRGQGIGCAEKRPGWRQAAKDRNSRCWTFLMGSIRLGQDRLGAG
jgi:hypothetical protein